MNPDRQFLFSCPSRLLARRSAIGMLLGLCLLLLMATAAHAAENRVTFNGSIASVPVTVGARAGTASRKVASVTGLTAAQLAAPLEFSVALEMRNLAEFQARIGNGELVPYEEVQAKYMPLQADYDRVLAWLKGQGFTPTFNDNSRLSIFVEGTVAQVQSSFGVTMQSVTVDGVAYTSAISAPSLPASVTGGVLGINGLQPHLHKQTHHRSAPTKTASGKTPDSLTSANNPPFLVSEIRNAYNGGTLTTTAGGTTTTLTGSGQKTAILIDALALHTDLTTFWSNQGIPQSISNIEEVKVVSGTAATQEEETLDEAWSSGIAPGSKVRVYASYTLTDTNLNKCLAQIQTDVTGSTATSIAQPQLHEMSMSYGGDQNAVSTSELKTEASYYATIANGNTFYGGVSIFASSGDDGSQPDETATPASAAYIVSYPAADVSITGVGGTDLYYSSTAVNGRNWTEKGWGEVISYVDSNGTTQYEFGGSGGGAATSAIPRPTWQVGTGVATGTTRLVPDLSSVGGPTYAYLIYNGAATGIYGTSWSSPTWAGFAALINQARALQGRLPMGALNRRVYPLIGTGNFYDTTTGNNSYTSTKTAGAMGTGNFSCTTGYDEVTGVGTPNLTALVSALTGPTVTGFTPASGAAGTSVVITGTNFYTSVASPLTVTFNGTAATSVTVNSATQITAVAPSGVTTGSIVVTSIGDAATSPTSFTVGGTVSSPAITSFTPTSGAVGASVTITGTNLTSATAVSFNGTPATITSNTATQIVTAVPTGATTGTISVTTAGGTATSSTVFTVTTAPAAPTITGFSPSSGPVGTSVTIVGTNLSAVTAVAFNGTAATVTSNTATQVAATVPTGATTGTITVTTANGTVTSATAFTVTAAGASSTPVISQVYGGGGGASATYTSDYVELFNPGTVAVDVSAYSVQYASAAGSAYTVTKLTGSIPAQHYYLVVQSTGAGLAAIPVTADVTSSTSVAMSATAGKVALVSNQTALSASNTAGIVDFIGYGTTASIYEGAGPAPAPSNTTADFRANGGYTDTNNNASDFSTAAPNPRNSSVANTSGGTTTAPDMTVSLTHGGSFTQADTGDAYTITVTNAGTAATTGVTVSVTDTLPSGLTATGLSGTGWTIAANNLSATRSDVLAAGGSYPALTLTVSVSSTAASSVTNMATVAGGGETNTANDSASDTTTITALTPSQSWRYQYFGTTANTGNAADTANPSGDGLVNLVKYALGLDPRVPTANPMTESTSTGYLSLTVPKNANATDLTYTVQVTGDLTNPTSWTATGTTVDQSTSTTLQVHDNTPVSGTAKRFIRLQVSR